MLTRICYTAAPLRTLSYFVSGLRTLSTSSVNHDVRSKPRKFTNVPRTSVVFRLTPLSDKYEKFAQILQDNVTPLETPSSSVKKTPSPKNAPYVSNAPGFVGWSRAFRGLAAADQLPQAEEIFKGLQDAFASIGPVRVHLGALYLPFNMKHINPPVTAVVLSVTAVQQMSMRILPEGTDSEKLTKLFQALTGPLHAAGFIKNPTLHTSSAAAHVLTRNYSRFDISRAIEPLQNEFGVDINPILTVGQSVPIDLGEFEIREAVMQTLSGKMALMKDDQVSAHLKW